ncbi:MAG: DNA recombination protein RmuC [Holosporaceae bacterium]|jgi:DNA recombination protein RmuC|nr:DNA recombination protein RmuC [Holosporaceae bacterium]
MTAVIQSLLAAVLVCIVVVQRTRLREMATRNAHLKELEEQHHRTLLENASLTERCHQFQELESRYQELSDKYIASEKEAALLAANLEQERRNLSEKLGLLENAEKKLTDAFKNISSEALLRNNQSFVELANVVFDRLHEKTKSELAINSKTVAEHVFPVKTTLDEVRNTLSEMEKIRIGAYEGLKQQVNDLISSQNLLRTEANRLVAALKAPHVRGHWGEVQLRRVVELAGMLKHCDFREQVSAEVGNTRARPDMVIYLPGGGRIIVDAKVPLSAYMDATESKDEPNRKKLLQEHVKQIRACIQELSGKRYWEQFPQSPEFVIMFLPGEAFLSVALEEDQSLLEYAMSAGVVVSTPTTFLAILRTIAMVWRQESFTENARQVTALGQELYRRITTMSEHFVALGRSMRSSVNCYNEAIGSLEGRVLVTARKFKVWDAHGKNIIELTPVGEAVREVNVLDSE